MVSENKIKAVEDLKKHLEENRVIGLIDVTSLPSAQMQSMRKKLRGKALIKMFKKSIINHAFDKSKKKDIKRMNEKINGIPALILTNENPFQLAKIIRKSKMAAKAKVGDVLDKDVEAKAGPTDIAAGPAIGQLQKLGIQTSVKEGKINIESDKVIAKAGDTVTKDMVTAFSLLDAKPMEIGMNLLCVYEDGKIYEKELLELDEEEVLKRVKEAFNNSLSLSIAINYPTKENITFILSNANLEATSLSSAIDKINKTVEKDKNHLKNKIRKIKKRR